MGAFTAIVLLAIVPSYPISPLNLLIRALTFSTTVFIVSGATTLLTLRTGVLPTTACLPIALRTASTAIWLAPLIAIFMQKSWFAIVLWIAFCVEVTRTIACLRNTTGVDTTNDQFAESMFWFPHPNWRPGLLSLAGAFLFQFAVAAAIGLHSIVAAFLGVLGTIVLVWRGVWMLEASPPTRLRYSKQQIFNLLSITTSLIVLSWLPYFLQRGDFRSLAMLWKFFTTAPEHPRRASANQPDASGGREGGGSPLVPGAVFPGVILYPQLKPVVTLVAPPTKALAGSGTKPAEPLSIPFNGVYWLWRFPEDELPATAVRKYGNPDEMGFRSTDGSSLWMEANQNLGKTITLDWYSAIQVVIDNADAQAKAVAMELMLGNTAVEGRPFISLGTQNVSARTVGKADVPVSQTLTYRVPDQMKLGKFDEVKVVFRLQWLRRDKSAKIAINRFVLVPAL
jgi:hypothetical protein